MSGSSAKTSRLTTWTTNLLKAAAGQPLQVKKKKQWGKKEDSFKD